MSKLTEKLAGGFKSEAPHVIIEARAGTGKTTTLVEGLKRLMNVTSDHPASKNPSPQQRAVWDALDASKGKAKSVCFAAFNSSIAKELQSRVPAGCDAMTMHSMGFRAVRAAFGNVKVNEHRVEEIICDILGADPYELRREHGPLLQVSKQLVSLAKMNLVDTDEDEDEVSFALLEMADHYEIETEALPNWEGAVALIVETMSRCKEVDRDNAIDFSDMIWLPVALELPVKRYDLLLVDEAQDMNRCQQALAKRAGKRLVLCGDPKQAIYGFAGADSESMNRMFVELGGERCPHCSGEKWTLGRFEGSAKQCPHCEGKGYLLPSDSHGLPTCVKLPLTVTRRCGKSIVKEANKIVADFHAFETNGEGKVSSAAFENVDPSKTYRGRVQPKDMILCRVNAPLVSQCFRFIKEGRKAVIRGRDVGQGLISTVTKLMKSYKGEADKGCEELVARLSGWLADETAKENKKRFPNENKTIDLQDRYDCLICFTEGNKRVEEVIKRIESIFTDDSNTGAILLSSIHKAKGLEAHRVFLLEPKGASVPHPMAKSDWQVEQEWNLRYVAITRAIEELVFVA